MLIPCHNITLRGSNGTCSTKTQPKYFAKMYAAVWRRKLLDDTGITITELPLNTLDAERYRYAASVETEERAVIAYFANSTTAVDQENNKQAAQARDLFQLVFPNGLREEIEKLIREDADRVLADSKKPQPSGVPHPSFIEAGATVDEAMALQKIGYANLDALPDDLMEVMKADGLTPGRAVKLLNTKHAAQKPMPPMASPLAGASKKG